jgi:hypothetical protein
LSSADRIGIGSTQVFSWIQARVLTPLPGVARGSDFYLVEARGETGGYPGLSWPEYRDLTDRLTAFREVIAFRMAPLSVGAADWSERSYGVLVSGNYFSALGLRAQAGRLEADTAAPEGPPSLSCRIGSKARLAGAADAVGRGPRERSAVHHRRHRAGGICRHGDGLTLDLGAGDRGALMLSTELEPRVARLRRWDLKPECHEPKVE